VIKNYYNKYKDNYMEKNIFDNKLIIDKEGNKSLPLNIINLSVNNEICNIINSFKRDTTILINVNDYKSIDIMECCFLPCNTNKFKQTRYHNYIVKNEIILYCDSSACLTNSIKILFENNINQKKLSLNKINNKKIFFTMNNNDTSCAIINYDNYNNNNKFNKLSKNTSLFLNIVNTKLLVKLFIYNISCVLQNIFIKKYSAKYYANFLSSSLKNIIFKSGYDKDIFNFPNNVRNLELGCCYNTEFTKIPLKITTMIFSNKIKTMKIPKINIILKKHVNEYENYCNYCDFDDDYYDCDYDYDRYNNNDFYCD
jgi:hypothetical protein